VTVWFVTPAFGRYELSAVCFDQRRLVIEALAEHGVEAHQVVVADDGNLDLARDRGFDVVVQDNTWLGRRFNDGIEYACLHGASRVIPIGSDSWLDPAYLLPFPPISRLIRTSGLYCAVTEDRLAELDVSTLSGAGPYVLVRHQLRRRRYRPARDDIVRGVDRSTVAGLPNWIRWQRWDVHPFQYVGFRGTPHLTPYDTLVAEWGVREHDDPWEILARHYPADLVERARIALTPVAA
jgi:hypothetical protein